MLPIEIQQFFYRRGIKYEILTHSPQGSTVKAALELGIDPAHVAVTTLVRDAKGALLTIYPANTQLDLVALNEKLSRQFVLVPREAIRMEWPTYNGSCLPLALIYQVGAEVHDSFARSKPVYFSIGNREFCRIAGADFCRSQGPAMYDSFFVTQPEANEAAVVDVGTFQPGRKIIIQERLKSVQSLPAMPSIAQRLLQLNVNPYAGTRDLAAIIEQDPSLSAQLVRYARSPLYAYTGEIKSIHDVIARVLGYDMVLDMALGVSVGKMFRNPKQGKLGLTEFWRHATYSAVLCQKLAPVVNATVKPRPGMAYLAGLLHNFGFLLLGHLFPQDFAQLNKAATKYPETPTIELEHTMIGVSHMELGVWLMQAWNMPDEIVASIREHHNEHYHDTYAAYPNLVMIANRLLHECDVGDETSSDLPEALLTSLGLDAHQAHKIFEEVMSIGQGLEYMALQMAA